MANTLEEKAFFTLLCEKNPALNKNFIKEFMKVNKLFTMKDFLNKYDVLNQKTMNELHNDMLEFMFT